MVDFSDFYRVDIFAYNRFKLASDYYAYTTHRQQHWQTFHY